MIDYAMGNYLAEEEHRRRMELAQAAKRVEVEKLKAAWKAELLEKLAALKPYEEEDGFQVELREVRRIITES